MMRAYERFLKYVAVYTTSDGENPEGHPSTQRQFVLADMLAQEMRELGLAGVRVDERCYVYGHIPATPGCGQAPAIGLVAHMDTSPDCRGDGVVPLLHWDYHGGDVTLPGDMSSIQRGSRLWGGLRTRH